MCEPLYLCEYVLVRPNLSAALLFLLWFGTCSLGLCQFECTSHASWLKDSLKLEVVTVWDSTYEISLIIVALESDLIKQEVDVLT